MRNLIYLLISILSFPYLNYSQNNIDILPNNFKQNKDKIVFIEYVEKPNTGITFGFGKVVIYDLNNNSRLELTNDSNINQYPSFSTDGKYVYYSSTMRDNPTIVKLLGFSAQRRLFRIKISNKEIEKYDFPPELYINKYYLSINNLEQVNDSLFFFLGDSFIFSFNKNNNQLRSEYVNSDSNLILNNYKVNLKKSLIAISLVSDFHSKQNELLTFNILNKKEKIISKYKFGIDLGGWSSNGNILCFKDSVIKLYNCNNNKINIINTSEFGKDKIEIEKINLMNDREIIVLGKITAKKGTEIKDSYDLYVLNIISNKMKRLTNDGNFKQQISTY